MPDEYIKSIYKDEKLPWLDEDAPKPRSNPIIEDVPIVKSDAPMRVPEKKKELEVTEPVSSNAFDEIIDGLEDQPEATLPPMPDTTPDPDELKEEDEVDIEPLEAVEMPEEDDDSVDFTTETDDSDSVETESIPPEVIEAVEKNEEDSETDDVSDGTKVIMPETKDDLKSLFKNDLKKVAQSLELSMSGSKRDLIKRISEKLGFDE